MRIRSALARWIVRAASLMAPRDRRGDMVAEWDAELSRELHRGGGWSAVAAAVGAFPDAWALRRIGHGARGVGEGRRMGGHRGDGPVAELLADLRVATRSLRRTPGFTAVSIVTLAVGLGSVSAVYTLVDRIVLDPLPYPDSERLVRLANQVPGVGPDAVWALSTAQQIHFTDHATTLSSVGIYRTDGTNVMTPSGPRRARLVRTTASVLPMLGAEARLGRGITGSDDLPTAELVVVLSDGFWRRALGADPDIVGSSLSLDGRPVTVVGVLEPGVHLPGATQGAPEDIWMPMRIDRAGSFGNNHVFEGIGRLADGASPSAVDAELERLTTRLPEAFPNAYSQGFFERYGFRTFATPLREDVVGDADTTLWVLLGGVALVLLVACANVSNLFLVRVESRRRELSLRRALGADRRRLTRYILSESVVLAVLGGALAVVTGLWAIPALVRLAPEGLPRIDDVAMGWDTAGFTFLASLAVGLVVALYPLVARTPAASELAGGGRASSDGPGRQRVRGLLVVSQMALAVALLVGAGLLVESLGTLRGADPGFRAEGVLAVDLFASSTRYPDDLSLWDLHRRILEGVRAIPGVTAAGMGEELPVTGGYGCTVQGFEDETVYDRIEQAGMTTCAGQERVTPGYFEALGIPLLEGRLLEPGDNDDPTRAAVVVSRAFAERFWPGESALGKGVGPSGRTVEPFYRVVGMVGDVAKRSEAGQPPLSQPAVAVYYPGVHNPETPGWWGFWWPGAMSLVVRTGGVDPSSVLPAVRRVVSDIDPEIPLANARPMSDVVDEAMAGIAFLSTLMIVAALAALLLAAVGLYGVVSWVVSRRTREIGMRLAIGAAPSTVVRGVVGRTLGLACAGLLVGIPLAYVTSRVGRSVLVGVEPTAPVAYLAAATAVLTVSLLASWVPARRAAAVDPATSLRAE